MLKEEDAGDFELLQIVSKNESKWDNQTVGTSDHGGLRITPSLKTVCPGPSKSQNGQVIVP